MIQIKPFKMQNLLTVTYKNAEDKQLPLKDIEALLESKGVQISGPLCVQLRGDNEIETIKYFIPLNVAIESVFDETYGFEKDIMIKEAAYMRIHDTNEEAIQKAYSDLEQFLNEKGYERIDFPYQVIINIYGETLIDLYVPCKEMEGF